MTFKIYEVAEADVDAVFPSIARRAAVALRHVGADDLTVAGLREALIDGRFVLWVVVEEETIIAFVVLNVVDRPEGRTLIVVLVAGVRFAEWAAEVQRLLEEFMGIIGARRMESCSRKGMEKWLRGLGWRPRAVIMEFKRHG